MTANQTITQTEPAPAGIHVVAKPMGPLCNLDCSYCFYLEKQSLFGDSDVLRMSEEVLEAFIRNYIWSQPTPVVEFVWQGGEPTLAGIDFFRQAIALQQHYAGGKSITNVLQTNGTLLTDEWCLFLKQHNFMVGISLDGPREIHDRYRLDRGGSGTFDRVLVGLRLLKKHGVDFNVMASVARDTARRPLEVYRFFRDEGVEFVQFVPIVERLPDEADKERRLRLARPISLDNEYANRDITTWTVIPEEYGDFLTAVYEEWVRHDVGKIFVMNFEWALNAWIGNPSPVCIHAAQCGRSLVVEHNGDVFTCDHYVYPECRLGNVMNDELAWMVNSAPQSAFGAVKESALPGCCRECEVLAACRGGCPKHRFKVSHQGEAGLHYLCRGYKKFFTSIRKYLRALTTLIENGLPASDVIKALKGPLVIKPQGVLP